MGIRPMPSTWLQPQVGWKTSLSVDLCLWPFFVHQRVLVLPQRQNSISWIYLNILNSISFITNFRNIAAVTERVLVRDSSNTFFLQILLISKGDCHSDCLKTCTFHWCFVHFFFNYRAVLRRFQAQESPPSAIRQVPVKNNVSMKVVCSSMIVQVGSYSFRNPPQFCGKSFSKHCSLG